MSAAGHISFFSHALRILNDLRETCGEGDMLGSAEWVAQAHLFVRVFPYLLLLRVSAILTARRSRIA